MMMIERCPTCGNGPDDMELMTEPILRDGKVIGHELYALRCTGCSRQIDLVPCGECHLQPGEVCDICGAVAASLVAEPAGASTSGSV